jgi:hypothetical protein
MWAYDAGHHLIQDSPVLVISIWQWNEIDIVGTYIGDMCVEQEDHLSKRWPCLESVQIYKASGGPASFISAVSSSQTTASRPPSFLRHIPRYTTSPYPYPS